ncbi:MAG: hypothetical protein ISS33_00010 [Candidatus Omnitrophica bacterium]|nr:hypothetical protein [Candidatus Omnitrophota bacterium]
MNSLNIYLSIPFVNIIVLMFFAGFVYLKNPRSNINIRFSVFVMSVTLWNLASFLWSISGSFNSQLFWYRMMHSAALFVSVFFLHFVISFLKIPAGGGSDSGGKNRILLKYAYFAGILTMFLSFTPYFLSDINVIDMYSWSGAQGPFFYFFLFNLFGLGAAAMFFLVKAYLGALPARKNLLKYIIFPAIAAYAGGALDFLPHKGIAILPYSKLIVTTAIAVFAYAIVAYKLFNINVIIRKTVVYTVLVTIITIFYFAVILVIENKFRVYMGYGSFSVSLFVIIVSIIIFQPLKNYIQSLLDRSFFKGTIVQIGAENDRLREEVQKTEKLKAISTLAAGMAHEIKNPLTSIKTFTEFLPKKFNEPEFIAKFHTIVASSVDSINNIVQQLLHFSKPDVLKLEKIHLNELLDNTLTFLSNDLLKKEIKISTDYAPTPVVEADPVQLKQVFLNILLNAIDAMPTGGKICIEIVPELTGEIFIKIKDTGKGISKEDLKHIFDPFFTKKEFGTGLGLSVVHGIIKKHRGKIVVNSRINKGTEFNITLPRHFLEEKAS